jgi:hypothetical protein
MCFYYLDAIRDFYRMSREQCCLSNLSFFRINGINRHISAVLLSSAVNDNMKIIYFAGDFYCFFALLIIPALIVKFPTNLTLLLVYYHCYF